jgi:hypothetical protein
VSDDPVCCGEIMTIDSSYDGDDDVYVYVCVVNRRHSTAIENDDDETWK